ncbi:O-antigen translocase [Rhodopirellula sp. JC737]|nr:O-antigen translocase [Rhodopirellula sp. JC737]
MLIGLIRTKAVAVLIGPTGVGLLGIYQTVTSMTLTLAGLGIQTSGVREIAKDFGTGEEESIGRTVRTLRRVCWLTGFAGMLLLAGLAPWISEVSFGTRDYTWSIVAVSCTILLGNITAGQSAIIQGTRRIGDLARINVIGALIGTITAVAFYYCLGIEGIVPALITMSVISLVISSYFAQKIPIAALLPKWRETWDQSKSLVRFGLAMVYTGVISSLVAYFTRVLIIQELDLASVGIYTAAFTLSGMFVNFVLQAMGADYYPRLTAEASDPGRMTQIINEQTEIGAILAFPGLLATLAFAPLIISIFYSAEFAESASMLKWFAIGCIIRVFQWPLGFALLALGKGAAFAQLQSVLHGLHLAFIWFFLRSFGITGVSIAFAMMYICGFTIVLCVVKRAIYFKWSANVKRQITWMLPVAAAVLALTTWLPKYLHLPLATGVTVVSSAVCVRELCRCVGPNHRITKFVQRLPGCAWLLPRAV